MDSSLLAALRVLEDGGVPCWFLPENVGQDSGVHTGPANESWELLLRIADSRGGSGLPFSYDSARMVGGYTAHCLFLHPTGEEVPQRSKLYADSRLCEQRGHHVLQAAALFAVLRYFWFRLRTGSGSRQR